jgi:hypothetical protein
VQTKKKTMEKDLELRIKRLVTMDVLKFFKKFDTSVYKDELIDGVYDLKLNENYKLLEISTYDIDVDLKTKLIGELTKYICGKFVVDKK